MMYDINLIPQTKKNTSGRINSTMVFIGLFCLVVLAVFFFYFPLQKKLSLNKQIQAKEEELSIYSNIEAEYITLLQQSDRLEQTAQDLKLVKSSRAKLTDLVNKIEKGVPEDITIESMKLEGGLLTVEGTSPDYKEIAQFMVNMRKTEGVLSVSFMGAAALEDSEEAGTGQGNKYQKDRPQSFTVGIGYDIKDTNTGLGGGTEEDSKGGGEE